jgi:hypothetical protein
MASNKIPGNIIGVQIGDDWLQCQAEATLNMVGNTSEDELCKKLEAEGDDAPWKTFTIDSREWSIDVGQSLLKDSFATLNDPVNLGKLFIDGDLEIASILFRTKVDQQFADNDMIYEGAAILTNFSVTAPSTGANTTSATFQGNGALTYSFPPKTT